LWEKSFNVDVIYPSYKSLLFDPVFQVESHIIITALTSYVLRFDKISIVDSVCVSEKVCQNMFALTWLNKQDFSMRLFHFFSLAI